MADLFATLNEIYDYGQMIATPGRRIVACNYLNQVVFAHPDAPLLSWPGYGTAAPVPGLPLDEDQFDGINAFQGFLVAWRGNRLKWNSQNDYTEWIPVGETASSFVFTLQAPYTLGAFGVESPFIYVNESPDGLVSGQFMRIDSAPTYTFFTVGQILPVTDQTGNVVGFNQNVAAGVQQDIFIQSFVPYVKGAQLYFAGSPDAILEVQKDAVPPSGGTFVVAQDFTAPAIGDQITVSVQINATIPNGSYVSIGPSFNAGQDIYFVEAVDIQNSQVTMRRTGVSLAASRYHRAGEFIVPQPSVRVKNISSQNAHGSFLTTLNEKFGFTLIPQNLTGASSVGSTYAAGTEVLTLDANGAGELINAGSSVNGDILRFEVLADYGYILKHRSIQSVQFTGIDQGTFFIRPEITDEGLIGRYSFVKVGQDLLYIWGNRGLYQYGGGNQLTPIAQLYVKQLLREVDLTKANQIVGYHNEPAYEIWFIYPSLVAEGQGPLRVFIYNYVEQSVTIDDYSEELEAISGIGRLAWSTDLLWGNALGTWATPLSWPSDATWLDLGADEDTNYAIIGAQESETIEGSSGSETETVPELLVFGGVYDRKGAAYPSTVETIDYDAGDSLVWKYVDTVFFSLQVPIPLEFEANLNVQVGVKKNYDDDLVWSDPVPIRVDGSGNFTSKVNIVVSGKYFRVRLTSDVAGIQWRVSQMRILGRKGMDY